MCARVSDLEEESDRVNENETGIMKIIMIGGICFRKITIDIMKIQIIVVV